MAGTNATEYEVLEIKKSDKTLNSAYSASIKGKQDVEIRPQISGLITQIHVKEGDRVSKGEALFTIDQVPYLAALNNAVANVNAASAEVETAMLVVESKQALYHENVVSEYDLKTAQNSLKKAEAQLAQAEAARVNAENDLSYTVVKSPVSGVVGTLPYRVGALVGPSITTPLTSVSDNSDMYVYFSLSENRVLSLIEKSGSLSSAVSSMPELSLKLSTGELYSQKGRVEAISGVLDKTTGSLSVRSVFPNKEGMLLSGGSGSVIMPFEMKNVIVIPQSATFELQDRRFVYKLIDGKAESSEITVYPVNDGKIFVVTSGLAEGDVIVSEGVGLIKNGSSIIPKNKKEE
ncbi:MAG: efflux RND transporter periplasmic adaptor subunit [Muribaculaceae bacterium]